MKITFTIAFLIFTCLINAQNDEINKERYKVINAIYAKVNVEKYGQVELDKNFFPFLGLGVLISDGELIDNLFGNCADYENEIIYTYKEILSDNEISEMRDQIDWFGNYRIIDSTMVSDKIKIVEDKNNLKRAITLPLVFNDKAIVYLTNKNNEETLFVLIKKDNEWIVRCRKNLYLRIDD